MNKIILTIVGLVVALNVMLPFALGQPIKGPSLVHDDMSDFHHRYLEAKEALEKQRQKEIVEQEARRKNVECLATVIYHEARGEPIEGQYAVGHVVINRMQSKHFPNSICGVAFQKHQFTDLRHIRYNPKALKVAEKIIGGKSPYRISATHFHTINVSPAWSFSDRKQFIAQIGRHYFYRMV